MQGQSGRIGAGLRLVALAAGLLTASCTATYLNHGFVPPQAEVAALQPGVDTREEVVASLGEPNAEGVLGEDDLYYVESRFRHFGPFAPEEISRQILALNFDGTGVLRNIESYGLEDGRVVPISRRVTDETLRDGTFLRQILGNIGNFDAGTFLGDE